MKNNDYIDSFKDFLTEEEKSKGTVDGYTSDVKEFVLFIGKDISKLERSDIILYKEHLRIRNLKTLTINRKLVGVKQFIDFINDRFSLTISARVKQEKVQKQYSLKDEELLTEEDFESLMIRVITNNDVRTEALFKSMYYSGMRVSEALQLRVDHIENELRIIEDIKGKGGKYRDIYINTELLNTLKKYLNVRKQPFSQTTKLLFVGERGPITRQTAHTLIKKYAAAAGISDSKAHVHNLRHLFGLRLAGKGVPIQDIAKFMGHTSIEVTKIYTEKPQSHYSNLIDQL